MMKTKRIALAVIILAIILISIYNIRKQTKTVFNEDNVQGNTGGNLINNGLFCEDDNKIYFSNPKDDGTLYSMNLDATNFKKVYDDKVQYINSAGKYIYYARRNNAKKISSPNIFQFNNTGIYRIKKDGSNIISLYSEPSGILSLHGNYVYYQHYSDTSGLQLYKVKIDGSKEVQLSNEDIAPASILEGVIYYSSIEKEHNIHTMDLSTGFSSLLLEANAYNSIATNEYIYYISLADNYSIYRINKDGSNPTVLVSERCSTYNISLSEKYLYYQVDDGQNNGIYRLNLETKKATNIISGNYNNINITSNFVFFQEFESDRTYIQPIGEQGTLSEFNPPILKQ